MSEITLAIADDIAAQAIAYAASIEVLAISVVVLDRTGAIRVLKRTNLGSLLGPEIALAKARTAMSFGLPTLNLNATFGDNPTITSAVAAATGGRFLPLGGGTPILHPQLGPIGAVGVAGSSQENDHAIAQAGADAAHDSLKL